MCNVFFLMLLAGIWRGRRGSNALTSPADISLPPSAACAVVIAAAQTQPYDLGALLVAAVFGEEVEGEMAHRLLDGMLQVLHPPPPPPTRNSPAYSFLQDGFCKMRKE